MRKRKLYNWQAPRDIKYPHIIVLIEPSEIAENEIRQVYPDLFKLNAGTFLTRTEDSSDKICKAIGIGNEGTEMPGVVIELSGALAGYAAGATWDWLKRLE